MIKLTELLHSIDQEEKEGLTPVDTWRWPDVDHLMTMGFEVMDDYHLKTKMPPEIVIYRKKDKDKDGKNKTFFYIEEPKKKLKRFETFNDVIDFFDSYKQEEIDNNM